MIYKILSSVIEKYKQEIEDWFLNKFLLCYPSVLNSSVDLRSSGYKIAPIDTNVFPAGYNNFNTQSKNYAAALLREYLLKYNNCKKILIIAEEHTRNLKYIDNIIALRDIVNIAGFDVAVGMCNIDCDVQIYSSTKKILDVKCIVNQRGVVKTNCGFTSDLILVNNDMTSGIPDVLQNLLNQYVMPSLQLGWFKRRKSRHFSIYEAISLEFCKEFGIDHWLICALFASCENICFLSNKGIENIANGVDNLISKIKEKFLLYSIKEQPYVFVKANNGTYGMGVITAYGGDDILNLNKRGRNKIQKIKGNTVVNSVLIQEGILTIDKFNGYVSEPLIYYIGKDPVCYLYRYNIKKNMLSNLNSSGCNFIDVGYQICEEKKKIWCLVSKLAVLSATMEMYELENMITR
ncbi:glutamate--cysteine ligase [Neoehrlichia mikurensis]|uniref:Glutamate--cysteine ligase n=1 Tax=Neoehrlichia mikurensis TaxID=89586 RepID=A0A9Q9C1C5_9RICK|nr:glutamate--cysteine ligase [Neoehrlichia mikurensis]QXK92267.1 glutamate--cysteine ligase [Neoehrlichia mikurensis]QXK92721.1 glutamate--cysteine ligase [Neoehrlichia mikurensis]QXK93960.1 glutamate--cysteine ligase [Neoehrlichia mikurensis]UTO55875.1 glutamate--cysteine ligase [Neoehrlichia mikurensis]UTO56791.1 glutamate--cysteine ligase [Neoehrlichia mikurensis]